MKIVEFKSGCYSDVDVDEAGSLKPLSEASLAEQLSAFRQKMPPTDPPRYLVLAPNEEAAVFEALGMLAKNMGLDRGMGRVDRLDCRLLEWVAERSGWQCHFIPTDGNATVPITEVASWSIAFRPLM